MPFVNKFPPPGGTGDFYFLPTGATGTTAQLTNFALAEILGIQNFDVGVTGAVWLNAGNWALSKGS